MDQFLDEGVSWWQTSQPPLDLLLCYPGLAMITEREMAILQLEQVQFPENRLAAIEVSQTRSGHQVLRSTVVFPTIIPGSHMYLTSRCRKLTGIEALNVQNIRYPQDPNFEILSTFSDNLLRDLAGNAFEASSCLVAVCLACIVMSATPLES